MTDRGQLTGIPSVTVIGVTILVTILVVEQALSAIPRRAPDVLCNVVGGCGYGTLPWWPALGLAIATFGVAVWVSLRGEE